MEVSVEGALINKLSDGSEFSQCCFEELCALWTCEDLLKMGVSKIELSFGLRKFLVQILDVLPSSCVNIGWDLDI